MWGDIAGVITHPNFIQGGGIVVALAQVFVLIYLIKVLVSLIHTFAKQVEDITKDAQERLRDASSLCSFALKEDASAKVKLAESMAVHSSMIVRLADTIDRKL